MKCRNRANNSCKWGENNGEKCLYDHTDTVPNNKGNHMECNTCDETLIYLSMFLKHRKLKHPNTVPECKSLREGKNCSFGEKCWFNHNDLNKHTVENHRYPGTKVHIRDDPDIININEGNRTKTTTPIFLEGLRTNPSTRPNGRDDENDQDNDDGYSTAEKSSESIRQKLKPKKNTSK